MMQDCNHQDKEHNHPPVILVVGSCGLDRLLTVPAYPQADAKIRSTCYCESGGGNAANCAHSMSLLLQQPPQQLCSNKIHPLGFASDTTRPRVQLCTRVGDDAVGATIQKELREAGVDLSGPLFQVVPDATTAFTTIIVANDDDENDGDPTRTCIHTYGSCGELQREDVASCDMDELFEHVIHFHSDARHTDAALFLAQQAKKRNIPISLDVEKDRHSDALDQLLPLADMIFTNALQIEAYLDRLDQELQESRPFRRLLSQSSPNVNVERGPIHDPDFVAHVLKPSMFFTRWYGTTGKEVIITKGRRGSIHVVCTSIIQRHTKNDNIDETTTPERPNQITLSRISDSSIRAIHCYWTLNVETGARHLVEASYTITMVGVSSDIDSVVDTTGAGDAFLGAFLVARQVDEWTRKKKNQDAIAATTTSLLFSSWVAGRKLGQPGARQGLPSVSCVVERLGIDPSCIQEKLESLVGSFSY